MFPPHKYGRHFATLQSTCVNTSDNNAKSSYRNDKMWSGVESQQSSQDAVLPKYLNKATKPNPNPQYWVTLSLKESHWPQD